MGIIARVTDKLKISKELVSEKIEKALIKNNLPINSIYSVEDLFNETTKDKIVIGSKINLIIPIKIGECILYELSTDKVKDFIRLGQEV